MRIVGDGNAARVVGNAQHGLGQGATVLTRTVRVLAEHVRQLERDVDRLSAHAWDAVAEVPVRAAWEAIVDARLRSDRDRTAIVFVDLDDFKVVNDNFGHLAGDVVLREVARRLERSLADRAAVVTRLGGDEFGAVGLDVDATDVARFTDSLREPIALPHGRDIHMNASIGLAHAHQVPNATREDLLRSADAQLYLDKATRREQATTAARASG